jgi:hypothetical protein
MPYIIKAKSYKNGQALYQAGPRAFSRYLLDAEEFSSRERAEAVVADLQAHGWDQAQVVELEEETKP